MDTPLVSFVIPTYNEEADIARTLDALMAMDYPRLEIIVVDDSTDRTPDIVRGYEARGVQLLRPAARRGRCAARNLGIRHATGEIVVILNADVFPERDFVRRIVSHYEAGADFLLVQARVANLSSAFARYIEAVHRFNYPDISKIAWTEGLSCRRQAALDVGLFPDGFPVPLTAGEDGYFGRALTARYKRANDPSIVVPHIAPSALGDFWRERISRGGATPVYKHYLMGRSLTRVALETVAKTTLAIVYTATVVGVVDKARRLCRHSERGRRDLLRFAGATALEWLGQVIGEWRGLRQVLAAARVSR